MEILRHDAAQAVRALRRNPGHALAALVTLVIGIGASASVFGLGHWLLMRPIPGVVDPDRLMSMSLMFPGRGGATLVSHPELVHLQAAVPGVSGLAGYFDTELNVGVEGGEPRRVQATVVSDGYFDVLGAPVARGRALSPDEAAAVAVVSDQFWRTALDADVDVLGRHLVINGAPFSVIGVTRPGFGGTSRSGRTDVWVSSTQHRVVLPTFPGDALVSDRASIYFGIVARRRAGVSLEQVEQQANAARASRPGVAGTRRAEWILVARPGTEPTPWMRGRVSRLMTALIAGVAFLLILSCANVANLMLARATGRRVEVATRLALGASRFAVARLLLIESVTLALAASAVAVAAAVMIARAIEGVAILPRIVTVGHMSVDWRVAAAATGLAVVVACLAAVVPAVTTARLAPHQVLRGGGRGVGGGSRVVRQGLTILQVGVSVALLLGAAVLVRSVQARLAIPAGFDPSRVLSVSLEPALQRYTPERTDAFYRELVTRVRGTAGIRQAGLAWLAPYSSVASDTEFWAEGATQDASVSANHNMVSPGYLDALGIPLIEGRDFTDAEFLRREVPGDGVVIITETLARRLFGGGGAAGRRITMRFPEGRTRTVVGVIADQRQHRVTDETADLLLEPFGQSFTPGFAALQLSASGAAEAAVAGVREAVRALDATLPLYQVRTLREARSLDVGEDLLVSRVVLVFAVLAMFVAAVGLAAVLARSVAERRREFGVRVACGATPRRVVTLVAREAGALASMGIGVGLVLAFGFTRLLESRVFGVRAFDPWSVGLVAGGVLVVVGVAALMPARRAAMIDPATVLR